MGEVIAASSEVEHEWGHFQRDVLGPWLLIPASLRRRSVLLMSAPVQPWADEVAGWLFPLRFAISPARYVFAQRAYRVIPTFVSTSVPELLFLVRRFAREKFDIFRAPPTEHALSQRRSGRPRVIANLDDVRLVLEDASALAWDVQGPHDPATATVGSYWLSCGRFRAFAGVEGANCVALLFMRRHTAFIEFRPRACSVQPWRYATRHLGQFHVVTPAGEMHAREPLPERDCLPLHFVAAAAEVVANYLLGRRAFGAEP